jgi:putative protease
MEQAQAALQAGVRQLNLDFEDVRRYAQACSELRDQGAEIWLATPRIIKPNEEGFLRLIDRAGPDGVLVRNLGAITFFKACGRRMMGDFSLNVANPLTAQFLLDQGLERLTLSYDLNFEQIRDLLRESQPALLELTLHQHMPMFHMEHCAFAAFLSKGTNFTNCGRPCDHHRVELRDRVGVCHPLKADAGCRNTLFNAKAQSGAQFYEALRALGLRHFRIELLNEDAAKSAEILKAYQGLIAGQVQAEALWQGLKLLSQLGVTRGTLDQL